MLLDEIDLLLTKRGSMPLKELASTVNISVGAALDLAVRCGATLGDDTVWRGEPPKNLSSQLQRQVHRLAEDLAGQKRLNKELSLQLDESEQRVGVVDAIDEPAWTKLPPQVKALSEERELTALLMASDWHVGERVDGSVVNGLNEYNPEIAAARSVKFFQNALRLIEKESSDAPVRQIVLWLGGDLITGYIHEELEESNHLSPTEEMMLVQELVLSGLVALQERAPVTVVCNYGNHGRTTKKKRISTGAKNSYEWLLYQQMAKRYHPDGVQWQIANGYFEYLQVYDQVIRFHHGDSVNYGGGIGGVTVPLTRFIHRANGQRPANLDVVGHFHTLTHTQQFVINGSLIGASPYSVSLGYAAERPQQGFQIIDSRYGFTTSAPILVVEE